MQLQNYQIRNFRRLEDVNIELTDQETIFVGANNSGKTSATMAFRLFLQKDESFKIFDFSSELMTFFDDFGSSEFDEEWLDEGKCPIPSMDMDLWFEVDPETEYGRVAYLLPSLSSELSEVGFRISYAVTDLKKLHEEYRNTYESSDNETEGEEEDEIPTLSQFLSNPGILSRFFEKKYFLLEKDEEEIVAHPLSRDEGLSTINSLLKVDFVDAQRNIDDRERAKSNRLSAVFAEFYRDNLKQHEGNQDSVKVIHEANKNLTDHYDAEFSELIGVIGTLGFPAINDRSLKILSELQPEQVLGGNTVLTYVDNDSNHRLPEAYNGLGFKNLIYIAIQISHFISQWAKTEINRPLCHLIFIEEPEVHLHAQVQQTFISNVRKVISKTLESYSGLTHEPQLIITTHSSHILSEASFDISRYFKRVPTKYFETGTAPRVCASKVKNLRHFDEAMPDKENLRFLEKYLKLTHCDLFFADAAILVEGTVEKLLLPDIITKFHPELTQAYLTILEVGGAYAHKFKQLITFIGLPTLIITDLDSVDPENKRSTCRADKPNAVTSNATITKLLDTENSISNLSKMENKEKECGTNEAPLFVTYQMPVLMPDEYGKEIKMIPRTLEESFIYENIKAVRDKSIDVLLELPEKAEFEIDYNIVYEGIGEKKFKKVEFALNQIETDFMWKSPEYINLGLNWLKGILGLNK